MGLVVRQRMARRFWAGGETVSADDKADILFGAAGRDWFFADPDAESLEDRVSNEQVW